MLWVPRSLDSDEMWFCGSLDPSGMKSLWFLEFHQFLLASSLAKFSEVTPGFLGSPACGVALRVG